MPSSSDLPFDRMSVLLIEDDSFTRSLVRGVLKKFGFAAVFEAADGLAALRLLQQHSIDLVISDIRMEPMDGLGFLERLRAGRVEDSPQEDDLPATAATVPVLFLSGQSDVKIVERARAAGIAGFLLKPVRPDKLRERIIAVLSATWKT
ncbi:MAG: response regulator [Azospirillaceae bacterium]|nr:response regulator [Azospirillaceae bacterium]